MGMFAAVNTGPLLRVENLSKRCSLRSTPTGDEIQAQAPTYKQKLWFWAESLDKTH